jgi:hypothetical protein
LEPNLDGPVSYFFVDQRYKKETRGSQVVKKRVLSFLIFTSETTGHG